MPYIFGEYMLDPQCYELRCQGTRIPLRPKVFQVLTYLIEQRHRMVTRDELLTEVWPDQCVGEEALTSCIKAARRAVGDSGQAQGVIRTVYGCGLRFVADVTVTDTPLVASTTPSLSIQTTGCAPSKPLAGRTSELACLRQWYATARQGQRQVGFITGEGGAGKTALVDAFLAQVATEAPVWIGHGQCIEQYGPGEAYLPVLAALGRLCRGPDGTHFLTWLRQQAPSWLAQMPALLPDTDRAAGQQLTQDVTPARMLRELAEALESLTAEQLLILVLEDLHWSDVATLEWLAYVARRRDPARLLVLCTYRLADARVVGHPLYGVTRELLVHGQGAELVLGALAVSEVASYVTQGFGAGALAAELGPVLYERTQGNPLFLVTMAADLVQRGILRETPAGWERTAALDTATVGVPETLRHLIEQQFERLGSAEQVILEAASVAGVDFSAAAVAAGVGTSIEDVDVQCARLARQGLFVQERSTAAWPDGPIASRYRFRHALYQEVVYDRIPVGCRARLHQRIGVWEEQSYGVCAGERATELAMHFELGQDYRRAIRSLQQAGAHAIQRCAHRVPPPA
jgi:predicted ATPase/DNA-binding winged helix-turn-helix (wHTH) protein